jgi:hypothetical protein
MDDNDFPIALGFLKAYTKGAPFSEEMLISASPSFDIQKSSGALGKRPGEQLLRLQQESGIQNQQLQQELEKRGIMPRGIQLPPV